MPHAFAEIAFTPSVKSIQERYGSRSSYARLAQADKVAAELSELEAGFIAQRDSFYQATISEAGWPYVQHRGGPPGFLKVLDAHTLGFADFRGNAQYVSMGNLSVNNRISLILMDYANRRRLKLLGTVRVVHADEDPELIARLEMPDYRARVERGIIISIQALDWNCPQHITQRFTKPEIEHLLAPLIAENNALKAKLAEMTGVQP